MKRHFRSGTLSEAKFNELIVIRLRTVSLGLFFQFIMDLERYYHTSYPPGVLLCYYVQLFLNMICTRSVSASEMSYSLHSKCPIGCFRNVCTRFVHPSEVSSIWLAHSAIHKVYRAPGERCLCLCKRHLANILSRYCRAVGTKTAYAKPLCYKHLKYKLITMAETVNIKDNIQPFLSNFTI